MHPIFSTVAGWCFSPRLASQVFPRKQQQVPTEPRPRWMTQWWPRPTGLFLKSCEHAACWHLPSPAPLHHPHGTTVDWPMMGRALGGEVKPWSAPCTRDWRAGTIRAGAGGRPCSCGHPWTLAPSRCRRNRSFARSGQLPRPCLSRSLQFPWPFSVSLQHGCPHLGFSPPSHAPLSLGVSGEAGTPDTSLTPSGALQSSAPDPLTSAGPIHPGSGLGWGGAEKWGPCSRLVRSSFSAGPKPVWLPFIFSFPPPNPPHPN